MFSKRIQSNKTQLALLGFYFIGLSATAATLDKAMPPTPEFDLTLTSWTTFGNTNNLTILGTQTVSERKTSPTILNNVGVPPAILVSSVTLDYQVHLFVTPKVYNPDHDVQSWRLLNRINQQPIQIITNPPVVGAQTMCTGWEPVPARTSNSSNMINGMRGVLAYFSNRSTGGSNNQAPVCGFNTVNIGHLDLEIFYGNNASNGPFKSIRVPIELSGAN